MVTIQNNRYTIEVFDDAIRIREYGSDTEYKRFTDWESVILYFDMIGVSDIEWMHIQFQQYRFWKYMHQTLWHIKQNYTSWPTIPVNKK